MRKNWTTILSLLACLTLVCGISACKDKKKENDNHNESSVTSESVNETDNDSNSETNSDIVSETDSTTNSDVNSEQDSNIDSDVNSEQDSQTSAHSHSYVSTTVNPTCTEEGATTYACECGDTYTDSLPALGHTRNEMDCCEVCGFILGTEGLLYNKYHNSAEVTGYQGTSANVIIPDTYEGLPVTFICNYAFSACNHLTNVIIPDSVTKIGIEAFYDCKNLTNLIIGNRVASIGLRAFKNCEKLTSVTIPDSVTKIGIEAFYDCKNLTNLIIGNRVASIGLRAFKNCEKLTSVTIPDSVTSVGEETFFNCKNLIRASIGNGVTSISKYMFKNCSNLASLVIGSNITQIDTDAFNLCVRLVEVVNKSTHITITKGTSNGYVGAYALAIYNSGDTFEGTKVSNENGYIIYSDGTEKILVGYVGEATDLVLPSCITKIKTLAFSDLDRLTSVVIPDNVTDIGGSAFIYCNSLTSVVIGENVTSIGAFAFEFCGITNLILPKKVATIGERAFHYSALTNVYYEGTAEDWAKMNIDSNNDDLTNATRYDYSETQPIEEGNYWRYVNGEPVVW